VLDPPARDRSGGMVPTGATLKASAV